MCKRELIKGIEAVKHNFSNKKIKKVRIWLSEDMKTLHYRSLEPNAFACFKRTRSVKLRNLFGFLYGAESMTFSGLQKEMRNKIKI